MTVKMTSPGVLKGIKEAYLARQAGYERRVMVCGGAGCVSCHCQEVKAALDVALAGLGIAERVQVLVTGCIGICAVGPVLVVEPEGCLLYTSRCV